MAIFNRRHASDDLQRPFMTSDNLDLKMTKKWLKNQLLIQIYSVITCGNLKAPEHGRISCSNRDRYDSKCSYERDTGYELIGAQVIFHF